MRVIAGSARRLILETPRGTETRPTTDKTKETLFNCLMPYLSDARFLDLFAGSGGIGIEALSRGSKHSVFVEKNKDALKCIRNNLKTTHFEDQSTVMASDVFSALRQLENMDKFDIIFLDPPFNNDLERDVLSILANSSIIDDDTIIVVESSNETNFSYIEELSFEMFKLKQYKNHQHIFLRKADTE